MGVIGAATAALPLTANPAIEIPPVRVNLIAAGRRRGRWRCT